MTPPPESERDSTGEPVAAADAAELRRLLLDFFDEHRRDLPWRRTDDPYRIWVSEMMLQQTRVGTVVPYYERWMERFPDVESLAGADPDEVLGAWKGLGYYSRARNLHRAAGIVRERFGGRLPTGPDELRELPGVGEYTAGAVASIAFGEPVPAVDGNVRRVLSRLFDLPRPGAASLRRIAGTLVDPERPGDFNQALMELGATICTPSSPCCGSCPVESSCLARARDTVQDRPPSRRKTPVRDAVVGVAVAVDPNGRVLVVRRPREGLLGGMEEFPGAEIDAVGAEEAVGVDGTGVGVEDAEVDAGGAELAEGGAEVAARAAALRRLGDLGVEPSGPPEALPPVKHAFTHLRVTYRPWRIPVAGAGSVAPDGESAGRWLPVPDLGSANLPVAQQRIAASLREGGSGG